MRRDAVRFLRTGSRALLRPWVWSLASSTAAQHKEPTMSKHTFSVFTSDIRRHPAILDVMQIEAAARIHYQGDVTITEHGPVTTVTAVAA